MYTETGTLTPTPPFDFDRSLNFLGVFMPTKQEQTISSHTLAKSISIDGQTIVFQLVSIGTTEHPQLEYTLFSVEPITEEKQNAVVERISFFLSLQDDLLPFYRIGQEDGDFAPIIEILYGYHQVPEAFQIAAADFEEILKLIRNDRRTEYLISTARAFSVVDEEFLKSASDEEVKAWLRNIKGIGEWSATFIMIRGLGRMEYVPLTEARLLEAASKVYGHGKELDREEWKRLAERYGPWQGYWAHYLRVGT